MECRVEIAIGAVDLPATAYQVFDDTDYEPVSTNRKDLKLGGWGYWWIRLRRARNIT